MILPNFWNIMHGQIILFAMLQKNNGICFHLIAQVFFTYFTFIVNIFWSDTIVSKLPKTHFWLFPNSKIFPCADRTISEAWTSIGGISINLMNVSFIAAPPFRHVFWLLGLVARLILESQLALSRFNASCHAGPEIFIAHLTFNRWNSLNMTVI